MLRINCALSWLYLQDSVLINACSISTTKMSHLKNINFIYHKFCIQYNKHKTISQSSTFVSQHTRSSQISSFLPSSASENILSYDHLFLLLLHHPFVHLGLIRILYPFITFTVFYTFVRSFIRSFIHSFIHSLIHFSFFLSVDLCHKPTRRLRY
jgi:hypothetical protein